MNDEIKEKLFESWNKHRWQTIGVVAGLVFGVSVLIFGLLKVLFLIICILCGSYIGYKADNGMDIKQILGNICLSKNNNNFL